MTAPQVHSFCGDFITEIFFEDVLVTDTTRPLYSTPSTLDETLIIYSDDPALINTVGRYNVKGTLIEYSDLAIFNNYGNITFYDPCIRPTDISVNSDQISFGPYKYDNSLLS